MTSDFFVYRISVIVPVYNSQNTLQRTIQSLLEQTLSQDDFEIILIDDGSSDKTSQMCDAYGASNNNIQVLHQANSGVSAARNNGILHARGKYLLFLDSDDTLSAETLSNISNFFDDHYDEVDLVTYPLRYFYQNGRSELHWRYQKILTKTGVYDLQKFSDISQTTINVCTKNLKEKSQPFNTKYALSEDQIYVTTILARNARIGFVKEAQYAYYRGEGGSSSIINYPYYSFDSFLDAYQEILDIGIRNPLMKKYAENIVIYNLNWRIKGDSLLPYHLKGVDFDQAMGRLSALINQIERATIMANQNMNDAHKFYLLSLKTKDKPVACCEQNEISLIDSKGQFYAQKSIQIVINQIKIQKDQIYMLAFLKAYPFAFTEKPKLFAIIGNNEKIEIPLFESAHSCFWSKMKTNQFWAFHFMYALTKETDIRFEVALWGITYSTTYYFKGSLNSIAPSIQRPYLRGKKYAVVYTDTHLKVLFVTKREIKNKKSCFKKYMIQNYRKQWLIRCLASLYQRLHRKNIIWIYSDSHDSLNNAYYQFQHDYKKDDGVIRYYIYHADNPSLVTNYFTKKQKTAMVQYNSKKHKLLMFAASKLLIAYTSPSTYFPFDMKTSQYYCDLFHYEVIYLQHGVMHAKIPHIYNKEKVFDADRIVVSSPCESEQLLSLGYNRNDILTCGMPRLDLLSSNRSSRRILLAPSWRQYLVTTKKNIQTPLTKFQTSVYFKTLMKFLQSKSLEKFLTTYDLYLDIQLHPMFCCYRDVIESARTKRINEVVNACVSDYLLCITDFSSFMYDFLYLNKPVISFIPDVEEFNAGLHSYREFIYPLSSSGTICCDNVKQVIENLEELAEHNFSMPSQIQKRVASFFYDQEATHRERLYQLLIKEENRDL